MDASDPFNGDDYIASVKPSRPAPRPPPLQPPLSPGKPEAPANPFSPLTGKLAHLPNPARKAPSRPAAQTPNEASSNKADFDYPSSFQQLSQQPFQSRAAAQGLPSVTQENDWDYTMMIARMSVEQQLPKPSRSAPVPAPNLTPWAQWPQTPSTPSKPVHEHNSISSTAETSDSWIQGGDLLLPDSSQLPPPTDYSIQSVAIVDDDDIFGLGQLHTSRSEPKPPPPDYDSLFGPTASTPVTSKAEPWDEPRKPPAVPGAKLTVDTGLGTVALATDGVTIVGPSPRLKEADASMTVSQMCIDLRNAPLQPKLASRPTLIASLNSCLVAAPSCSGGFMQWARVDSEPSAPASMPVTLYEDWDAVPSGYVPLPGGATGTITCMHVDQCSHTLWTGTNEGWVVRWSMATDGSGKLVSRSEWQASQVGKICSIAVTKWGEVWTGSSSGSVRVWTFAQRNGELDKPLKVRELKKKNGGKPHNKTRFVVVSPNGKLVWTAGKNNISLWSAYDGFLHGTLKDNGDPQYDDTYIDKTVGREMFVIAKLPTIRNAYELCNTDDEEIGGLRNSAAMAKALIGASKAAKAWDKWGRKVVANLGSQRKPGDLEQLERPAPGSLSIKAMVATPGRDYGRKDIVGFIWVMYKSGLIECYTELGKKMGEIDLKTKLTCLVAAEPKQGKDTTWKGEESKVSYAQICVGGADGRIRMLKVEGNVNRSLGVSAELAELRDITIEVSRTWLAHDCSIRSLSVVGNLLYSLAENGAVKGWSILPVPENAIDTWQAKLTAATDRLSLKVVAGTWNVNEERPSVPSLAAWLREPSQEADLVCVALQELEMGTSSVAKDAALSFWDQSRLEEGTANAQWWLTNLLEMLGPTRWERIASRQMSGMLVVVFAVKKHKQFIGEIATASVGCGVMGVGGNKGGVAISMTLYRKRIVVMCSHLAAHQEKVEERNADYHKISRTVKFTNIPAKDANEVGATSGTGSDGDTQNNSGAEDSPKKWGSEEGEQVMLQRAPLSRGLRDADLVIWAGDFNYRLCLRLLCNKMNVVMSPEIAYNFVMDELKNLKDKSRYLKLLTGDQLNEQRLVKKLVFEGMEEAPIEFPPTYKFEKMKKMGDFDDLRNPVMSTYEVGEKKRIPSWTDRILYRGSGGSDPDVRVECVQYDAIMHVHDSDHKPVFAVFKVSLRHLDLIQKRPATYDLFKSIAPHNPYPPAFSISPTSVTLTETQGKEIEVINISDSDCVFHVTGEFDQHHNSLGAVPLWLDLYPQVLVIGCGGSGAIKLSGGRPGWDRHEHTCNLTISAARLESAGTLGWQKNYSDTARTVKVTLR